jgi:hypothetical protein
MNQSSFGLGLSSLILFKAGSPVITQIGFGRLAVQNYCLALGFYKTE